MKFKPISILCLGALFLGPAATLPAADLPSLAGRWEIDVAKSSPIRPWTNETLDFSINGQSVRIVRHLQWSHYHQASNLTKVVTDGVTVTKNPVKYWLDTWYTNVYIGGDHQKHVTGEWLDHGRILKLETKLVLEAQQGDHPVHLYDEYRLEPGGKTMMLFELRSTRDQALTYVFHRVVPTGSNRKP